MLNGEAKGAVADAVGDVKEAGLAGTEGGAVVEDGWEPALADGDVEAGAAGPDAGEEVVVAGAGDVDALLMLLRWYRHAPMALEVKPSFRLEGRKLHRNTSEWVSGFSDKNYGWGGDLLNIPRSQTDALKGQTNKEEAMGKSLPPEVILMMFQNDFKEGTDKGEERESGNVTVTERQRKMPRKAGFGYQV